MPDRAQKSLDQKSWIETSASALRANVAALRRAAAGDWRVRPQFMAVVKANAYGHGLPQVVEAFQDAPPLEKPDWYGVDSLEEALAVQKAAHKKVNVLAMGYVPLANVGEAVRAGVSLTVYDVAHIDAAVAAGTGARPAKLHVKIETGTSRQGVTDGDLPAFARRLRDATGTGKVQFEGLSTHYANIEDTTDSLYAMSQLERFKEARVVLAKAGLIPQIAHTAASAATILFGKTHFDMVRAGIAMYGLWPSKETRVSAQAAERDVTLTPALAWKSIVAQVKDIPAGTPVSYGLTEKVTRASRVAVVPVGYWDGYDRGLSSVGRVLIGGARAKVLGRVCMNMFVCDVTDIPNVRAEDEVVLLGRQGSEAVSAEEMAAACGTINYETVTRINPLLPRLLVR